MDEYQEGDEYNPRERLGIRDEIEQLKEQLQGSSRKRKRIKSESKFVMPLKAKFGRKKARSGYCIVMQIGENKAVTFTKKQIQDGTIKLKDRGGTETIHALRESDLLLYKGRKPLIIQAKDKVNPYNPFNGDNQVYGQELIATRMMRDQIKPKGKMGGMMIFVFILIAAGVFFYLRSRGHA